VIIFSRDQKKLKNSNGKKGWTSPMSYLLVMKLSLLVRGCSSSHGQNHQKYSQYFWKWRKFATKWYISFTTAQEGFDLSGPMALTIISGVSRPSQRPNYSESV